MPLLRLTVFPIATLDLAPNAHPSNPLVDQLRLLAALRPQSMIHDDPEEPIHAPRGITVPVQPVGFPPGGQNAERHAVGPARDSDSYSVVGLDSGHGHPPSEGLSVGSEVWSRAPAEEAAEGEVVAWADRRREQQHGETTFLDF